MLLRTQPPQTRTNDPIRELLAAALYELKRRPWIIGALRREEDGGVCAKGALIAAYTFVRPNVAGHIHHAERLLERAAEEITGEPMTTIPEYNDKYAQTKDDVVRLYEHAIAACQRYRPRNAT